MRVFVASDNAEWSNRVRELLIREGQDCPPGHALQLSVATGRLAQTSADAVIVLLPSDPLPALAVIREVRAITGAAVLAVGPVRDPKLILQTIREGAVEYLDEADVNAELIEALIRLKTKQPDTRQRGKVISVMSSSGGSGTSTLAVNIATVLAKTHQSCALFDVKLRGDDLATLLDLHPIHTLADLCRNLNRMDRSMFEQLFAPHESGVHLLASPDAHADLRHVSAEAVHRALTLARQIFPYIVADLDGAIREEQTEVLFQSAVILVVLRLDFTALRSTRRCLEHLEELGIERDRVELVVNRYGQPRQLSVTKVEEVLGVKVRHRLPEDPKTVNRANNRGVPVVLERPSARVSRGMTALALSVNGHIESRA